MTYRFRGWDAISNRGWVYGDLVHNKRITRTGLRNRVMVGGYEVVPESVGIYIGLLDREGQEVYEGDKLIVSDTARLVGVVKWTERGLMIVNDNRTESLEKWFGYDRRRGQVCLTLTRISRNYGPKVND